MGFGEERLNSKPRGEMGKHERGWVGSGDGESRSLFGLCAAGEESVTVSGTTELTRATSDVVKFRRRCRE